MTEANSVADIERFGELLLGAERLGWRDPASIQAALEAARNAIITLERIIVTQQRVIDQLTGAPDSRQ
jgi:hypothetical protein